MKLSSKQKIARLGSMFSLSALLIIFTQCVPSAPKGLSSANYETTTGGGLAAAEAEAPSIGVKTAEEILYTMSAVTGISAQDGTINFIYLVNKSMLPANPRLDSVTETQLLAITKLAAQFCSQLIDDQNLVNAIWPGLRLDIGWQNAGSLNTESARSNFIAMMLERFWGAGVLEDHIYDEGFNTGMEILAEMLNGAPNDYTGTRPAAKAACTTALASSPVWIH